MNEQVLPPKKKAYLKNLTLIIVAFSAAFFPRIIQSIGAPSLINFVHFAVVPFCLVVAITTTRTKDRKQIAISWELLTGLMILFVVMLASAFFNKAGLINVILNYLLLVEPFMLLLAIICIPLSAASLGKLRTWLLGSALVNLVLAIGQYFLLEAGILRIPRMSLADNVQGVFYLTGAGNYVSVAVSISVALYYMVSAKTVPLWMRIFWLLAAFYQLLVSDSKQILLTFIAAWALLVITKFKDIGKALTYLIAVIVVLAAFYWCVQNLDIIGFAAFKHWLNRLELYGPEGEGTQSKIAGIRIIISYFQSPINWFLGLGPGHTVGRLGGWVLKEYSSLLAPLGATTHPATAQTWVVANSSWVVLESSMFMPLFTWAGVWGDLGFLGLGAYLYLGYIVWSRLCVDDISRLLLLTLFVFGLILTQMEEPGQTLTIAILIGLQWHERESVRRSRYRPLPLVTDADPRLEVT